MVLHLKSVSVGSSLAVKESLAAVENDWRVVVDVGANIGTKVEYRLRNHLFPWIYELHDGETHEMVVADIVNAALSLPLVSRERSKLILLTVGNTASNERMITPQDLVQAGSEGFVLRILRMDELAVISSNGQPMNNQTARSRTFRTESDSLNAGAITGAYAALEQLGFGFFHPLQPITPAILLPPKKEAMRIESPKWAYRGFHVHTQHPLELTDVLQGFDIKVDTKEGRNYSWSISSALEWFTFTKMKPSNFNDSAAQRVEEHLNSTATFNSSEKSNTKVINLKEETWESMLAEVESFFEWCAANRVNRIEWLLLSDVHWKENISNLRQYRLSKIVSLAHNFGLLVGVDVPIGLQQQHAWYMVTPWQNELEQERLIKERCTWVAEAGFDFISTESGLSEFTHPGDELMLKLMNTFAIHVNETLGLPASIKVHASQGQKCSHYCNVIPSKDNLLANNLSLDSNLNSKLNFNFLPTYASTSLGVMPHTVQAYGLDDFTANVYGNSDFSEMRDYMFYEAKQGLRSVVYYGETAYWVSVDVDVPLFLPIYGERRLHDLRLIASEENKRGFNINGQMNFDSGWEWSYWLNDVITARAAWDPKLEAKTDSEAMYKLIFPLFSNVIGEPLAMVVSDWLVRLATTQHTLLILGQIPNIDTNEKCAHEPHSLLTGIAYLSGSDTWFDLPRLFGVHMTQPDRILPTEWDHPLHICVSPLLNAMKVTFSRFAEELETIMKEYNHEYFDISILDEFKDSIDMLVFRISQVHLIYQALSPNTDVQHSKSLLLRSRKVIERASVIVARREKKYRAPFSRIASWRESGPTSYRYGYLWSVHSLYYWWRDQGVAEGNVGPCYLNRMDPTQVAFGWGKNAFQTLRIAIWSLFPFNSDLFTNCLAPPKSEYQFPFDLHRYSRSIYSLFFGEKE